MSDIPPLTQDQANDLGEWVDPETAILYVGDVVIECSEFWTAALSETGVALDVVGNTPDGKFPPTYWAQRLRHRFPVVNTYMDGYGREREFRGYPHADAWLTALQAELGG